MNNFSTIHRAFEEVKGFENGKIREILLKQLIYFIQCLIALNWLSEEEVEELEKLLKAIEKWLNEENIILPEDEECLEGNSNILTLFKKLNKPYDLSMEDLNNALGLTPKTEMALKNH